MSPASLCWFPRYCRLPSDRTPPDQSASYSGSGGRCCWRTAGCWGASSSRAEDLPGQVTGRSGAGPGFRSGPWLLVRGTRCKKVWRPQTGGTGDWENGVARSWKGDGCAGGCSLSWQNGAMPPHPRWGAWAHREETETLEKSRQETELEYTRWKMIFQGCKSRIIGVCFIIY